MPFKNQHPLYTVWKSMKGRCTNPKHPSWHRYGGRGITVCDRWSEYRSGFHNFLSDMGERSAGLTLDRIDNDKGYAPENCRWASRQQQQRNMESTRKATIKGVEHLVVEVAERYGFKPDTLVKRAKKSNDFGEWVDKKRRVYTPGLALGGKASGAKKQAMTHCKAGHEFTPENTLTTKDGWRSCRACHAARQRERTARKKTLRGAHLGSDVL